MFWHPQGTYLAVQVDRFTKTKKSIYTSFELFSLKVLAACRHAWGACYRAAVTQSTANSCVCCAPFLDITPAPETGDEN